MPEHCFPLVDGWLAWRDVLVRAAGFPARLALELAARPSAIAAADAVLDAREAQRVAMRTVLHAAEAEAARLAAEGPAESQHVIARLLRHLKSAHPPGPLPDLPLVAPLRAALDQHAAALATWQREAAQAQDDAFAAVRRIANDPKFREAVMWQNRDALRMALDHFADHAGAGEANKSTRRKLALVANYLQRYATKNDTIGFFGPMAWARFSPEAPLLVQRPGPSLLASRGVYFEYWCIQALADRLAPEVRGALCPRRLPTVAIDGTTVSYPVDRHAELPVPYARALAACDGTTPARDIAAALVGLPDVATEADAYAILDELVEQQLILWTIEIPTHGVHPEVHLRAALDRIGDPSATAALDELEQARTRIAAAAGNPDALEPAFVALEQQFEATVGIEAERSSGQMYAGRSLVYEDCTRDLAVELGPDLVTRLGPPLALVLASARWYTRQIAERYAERLLAIHDELTREAPATSAAGIDFVRFWVRAAREFPARERELVEIVRTVQHELQARWATLLGLFDPNPRTHTPIHRRSADLRDAALRAFAAPGPGWPTARYHSPDIMVCASPGGELGPFVLGEVHPGANTLAAPCIMNRYPDPSEFDRRRDVDLGPGAVSVVTAREQATRVDLAGESSGGLALEVGTARSRLPRDQVIGTAELRVERDGPGLAVVARDGRRWDAIAFLEHYLIGAANSHFKMLPAARHRPRVSIDDLVIGREHWSLATSELAFAHAKTPEDRLLGAQACARVHGWPRLVFVKSPEELKPVFVDLWSPVFVDTFAKLVRGASRIDIGEMLPAVDQALVRDAAGERYTAELRLVAVDPIAWQPVWALAVDENAVA